MWNTWCIASLLAGGLRERLFFAASTHKARGQRRQLERRTSLFSFLFPLQRRFPIRSGLFCHEEVERLSSSLDVSKMRSVALFADWFGVALPPSRLARAAAWILLPWRELDSGSPPHPLTCASFYSDESSMAVCNSVCSTELRQSMKHLLNRPFVRDILSETISEDFIFFFRPCRWD